MTVYHTSKERHILFSFSKNWKGELCESCDQFEEWMGFLGTSFSNTNLVLKVIKLYRENITKRTSPSV